MTVGIVEIMGRAEQGATQPFICRGEDGNVYFVKGSGAGRRSLICELICGRLAATLGLPVAPFEIVDVPTELISLRSRPDLAELGAGLAFGSLKRTVVEITPAHIELISAEQKRDVLAFDWWVRNADRTLSEKGGNPNLFWNVQDESLVVIDHNQAFDPAFTASEFLEHHAFSEARFGLFDDWMVRDAYVQRFDAAYQQWPAIRATVPDEWLFADSERTVPTDFDFGVAEEILSQYQSGEFWSQE